jgi:transcriptional regulator with XRE-family HTH domain
VDNRADIRDFLATRRARLTPDQVGLAAGGGRRRVPGLRREEVAVLAGVSTEWYARLEKGHITGVSEDVLEAVARALRLTDDERIHLLNLARAARPVTGVRRRRKPAQVPAQVQWMLDGMTMCAAFVSNGRLDVVAASPLGRALYAPVLEGGVGGARGQANLARYLFLDPGAHEFYEDWDDAADTTVALLRAEAGRDPNDEALRELVGELSTLDPEFRTRWAAHDVRIHHSGVKRFRHPAVGAVELSYQSLDLPISPQVVHSLAVYTAEPGSTSEDRLRLLASWGATTAGAAESSDRAR